MNKNKDLCDLIKIVKLIEHHNSFDFGFSDTFTKKIVLFRRQILLPRLLGNIELTHMATLFYYNKIPFFWLDYHVIVPVSAEGLNWF